MGTYVSVFFQVINDERVKSIKILGKSDQQPKQATQRKGCGLLDMEA